MLAFPWQKAVGIGARRTVRLLRLPADNTFVLDQSGSMENERIASLKTALLGLSGADASISGRFARFRNRERIFLLPFSDVFGSVGGI